MVLFAIICCALLNKCHPLLMVDDAFDVALVIVWDNCTNEMIIKPAQSLVSVIFQKSEFSVTELRV